MADTAAIKAKLESAVTAYDRKQVGKRGYNIYALGIYLQRVDSVVADIEAGAKLADALRSGFCDRLLTHLERAFGLEVAD